jgi:2-methylcitrate dehydratase PrpD
VSSSALALARWAAELQPTDDDLSLAGRSLRDTVAVALAAREHPVGALAEQLGEAGRWSALAHVLDFDDLHLPSTAHLSAICVPAALACGGDASAYLSGAGVMARLGTALGWPHYAAGWHTTCTAGAPAAAVTAAKAMGLEREPTAVAIALAIPAAGGVQRAFGSTAKSLQVGFAADAGVRAAQLAAAGASADPASLDEWMRLVGGDPEALALDGPAVPGGLAIKLFPCCYALQRPIGAVVELGVFDPELVRRVRVRTPSSSLAPLIHHRPRTGLEGKFSLEYGIAAAILDGRPGRESVTDAAVARPEARRLIELVEVEALDEGEGLLAGEVEVEVELAGGEELRAALDVPPGAPTRPPTDDQLAAKLGMCAPHELEDLRAVSWESAAALLGGAITAR